MVEIVKLGSTHNEFNILPVSGIVGLEVMNTFGTVKVLESSLKGPVFFRKGEIPPQKEMSTYYLSACFAGSLAT